MSSAPGRPDPWNVLWGPSPQPRGLKCTCMAGALGLRSRILCSWSPYSGCPPLLWALEVDAEASHEGLSPALSQAPSHWAPCLPPGEPQKGPQRLSHEGLEQNSRAHAEVQERVVPIR